MIPLGHYYFRPAPNGPGFGSRENGPILLSIPARPYNHNPLREARAAVRGGIPGPPARRPSPGPARAAGKSFRRQDPYKEMDAGAPTYNPFSPWRGDRPTGAPC